MAFKAKKENILDLDPYISKEIIVKFNGGREVKGTLRGYDTLVNLVLDDCTEYLRDPDDAQKLSSATRFLGLVVCKGLAVMCVYPAEGTEQVENPFLDAVEDFWEGVFCSVCLIPDKKATSSQIDFMGRLDRLELKVLIYDLASLPLPALLFQRIPLM